MPENKNTIKDNPAYLESERQMLEAMNKKNMRILCFNSEQTQQ